MKKRIFIAIYPSPEIIKEIKGIQNELRALFPGHTVVPIRWEHDKKFHFTLQFLGNQSDEIINKIILDIRQKFNKFKPFTITLNTIGYFPLNKNPKILWIGSKPFENSRLAECSEKITEITRNLGIAQEKQPFFPHITIGRNKGKLITNLIQKVETVTFHPIDFLCTEIHIIQSRLTNTGSTYTTLFTIPLQ